MIMFDASNRDQCEVKRLKTNTPLQALIMENDPTMLEASRVLAQNLAQQQLNTQDKITKAFRLIVCRHPTAKENSILNEYYTEQLVEFQQKKLSADATLKVGEYPNNDKADKTESAALMKVIEMIYNLEESITKT